MPSQPEVRSPRATSSAPILFRYRMQGFAFAILLYAVGILSWHISLTNQGVVDVSKILSTTKDAFVSAGHFSVSRQVRNSREWLEDSPGGEQEEFDGAIIPIE